MSDENERSVASAGSAVGEPAAWAVMDGTKTLVGYHSCSREKAEAWAREYGFPEVVPLYHAPTLTDAEREAVEVALVWVNPKRQSTLRGLLERLSATNKTDGYV